jgi:hypothetical protein
LLRTEQFSAHAAGRMESNAKAGIILQRRAGTSVSLSKSEGFAAPNAPTASFSARLLRTSVKREAGKYDEVGSVEIAPWRRISIRCSKSRGLTGVGMSRFGFDGRGMRWGCGGDRTYTVRAERPPGARTE